MVILVPLAMPGTNFSSGSVSASAPPSTSWRTAVATIDFVMLAIRTFAAGS
jgi:hypothetical protein